LCELTVDGALRVVETNCANCSVFYETNVSDIVRAVTNLVGR
jgi:protein-arginine kinase activator protein McsA